MDFHPIQQTLLLVITNVGDVGLWEVGSQQRLILKNFKVWNLSAWSMPLQAALVKDPGNALLALASNAIHLQAVGEKGWDRIIEPQWGSPSGSRNWAMAVSGPALAELITRNRGHGTWMDNGLWSI
ncbi:hypothetical protein L1987_20367 [Smallanthus sonchifolius]|uniref:Uncharacterized protein n=1 Tax=Smallanthus sonchifolius TaxID=185202 RepID=A0ACB9ITC0_9ASTR|nr:hypothetical protein L1987_20367 [Smallanthus sonchifolius]